jgi:hypothetical protein
MSTLFMTQLWRSQIEPYQRVAWFLFEAIEREQRLNLQAMLESSSVLPGWFSPAPRSNPTAGRSRTISRVRSGRAGTG